MRSFHAVLATLAVLVPSTTAMGQSLNEHSGFQASPDMSAEQILGACVAFAETASNDGTDLYQPAHSDYRYCLTDLRAATGPDLEPVIGEALTALLPQADPVVQMHTFLELGRIAYRPAAPFIEKALASDDWRVVVAAARALGAVGDASHLPALTAHMGRIPALPANAAQDTYLLLGGDFPFDEASAQRLDRMSLEDREEYLRHVEGQREYVREFYSDPERASEFWAGDRNTFGQPMGGGFDVETGDFLEACPEQVFIDDVGATVDLTREPPLDPGIMSPDAEYEIVLSGGGGRLVGERDTNPQWLGAGPAELRWVGTDGQEALVFEQPISFILADERGLLLIAGPGAGPSNGSVLRVVPQEAERPRLEKLWELTGLPAMAARFGPDRYAVMTLQQTAVAISANGLIERLECRHWAELEAGEDSD